MATNFSEDFSSREDSLKVFMNYLKKNDVYIIIFFLEEATSPIFSFNIQEKNDIL